MARRNPRLYLKMGGLIVVLLAVGFVVHASSNIFAVRYDKNEHLEVKPDSQQNNDGKKEVKPESTEPQQLVPIHIKTPEAVKAIYMSQCVAGTRDFRQDLVDVADETEINSIMIDIKDFTGKISFKTDNPALAHAVSDKCRADDMMEFIDYLHKKDIYVIGRITVFQDPYMTNKYPERAVRSLSTGGVWKDFKGLSFIDVGSRDHWKYIVELSKESYRIGFDELNFDYIRFPSDGNMKDTDFTLSVAKGKTRPEALEEFFEYIKTELKPLGVVTSADLFGMVTTSAGSDLGIGQVLERALPHFDYIAPMVYPSHYPKNFNGWANPNKVPYEIIQYTMQGAVDKANAMDRTEYIAQMGTSTAEVMANFKPTTYKKLRPWLQDFDYGGDYDIAEVKAQIKATYDVGLNSWMLWAPSNRYTIGALKKE